MSDRVDAREATQVFDAAGEEAENAGALLQFVRANYDALSRRLPEETMARAPRWHRELCSAEDRAAVKNFYESRKPWRPGVERNLSQALEAIDICVKGRAG